MRLRTFLVLGVLLGMNTPLCTGGVFALAEALARVPGETETLLMTPAPVGTLACRGKDMPRSEDFQSSKSGGCASGKTCLSKMTTSVKEILSSLPTRLHAMASPANAQLRDDSIFAAEREYTAADPPIASVLLSAHILIQRE